MFSKKRLLLFLSIALLLLTRFIKHDWGNGFFFHPDENNMGFAVSRLSFRDLNPRFFAYGQFPLYLAFLSGKVLGLLSGQISDLPIAFSTSIYILRFWSALFSVISIFFFYRIARFVLDYSDSLLYVIFLIFTPGLIQLAHFGTTESLLIMVFAVNTYLSLKYYQKPSFKILLFAGISTGIGLGSKITAIFFSLPFFLSIILSLAKSRSFLPALKSSVIYFLITVTFFIATSPYNIIDFNEFISSQKYETSVATGKTLVFYTRQFIDTKAYLFQLQKILPYTLGVPLFLVSFYGFFIFVKNVRLLKHKPYWLLILLPSFIYFLYIGQLFVKWTRFLSPIFFIFPLLAVFSLRKVKPKMAFVLSLIIIIPGIKFLGTYLQPDVRLATSVWINQNINKESVILSEAGNVVNLPLNSAVADTVNFDFYNLDQDPQLPGQLVRQLTRSDYLLIPSRRMFKNQNNSRFPVSQRYYQALFSTRLGFSVLKQFKVDNFLFLDPENAEETWTVFDHPTIRIYQKQSPLNYSDYAQMIL